ncbi:MAG: type II and III secretion system protein family protein [Kiloniellales bacterium]
MPFLLLAAVALGSVAPAPQASSQPTVVTESGEGKHAGEFIVPVDKSQVLRLDVSFADLLVGNAEIADVLALTDRSIYVLGKKPGSTSLTIYGRNKELLAVMDLVVTVDVEGLKARLFELMPNENIEVRAVNESVILSGTVSSAVRLKRALEVAERYAPDKVSNLLTVLGSQQVMLAVRFAEVQRRVAKELGLNSQVSGGDFVITAGDALLSTFSPTAFATGALTFGIGSVTLDFLFDALEEKGVVKTLAEPNLIALSGDTASFLAGGEFPVPVAQDSSGGQSTITIEFKEFGVALAFTPTVLDDGLINIIVNPEVSRVDPTNSVTLQGFEVPGLTTRRATTTVELRDGQSFAIAGLIQSDFQDTVRQFPLLADVPVLGALLRSSDYQNEQTELVIIVTPHLVKPAPAGSLVTPADNFVPPSDADIWLFGRTEAPASGHVSNAAAVESLAINEAGGVQGSYGHIIK